MNAKAQISIEVLIILSIFIVGAILFGAYYINVTQKNIKTNVDLNPIFTIENAEFDLDLSWDSVNTRIVATINNYTTDKAVKITAIDPSACFTGSLPISASATSTGYSTTISIPSSCSGSTINVTAGVETTAITSTETIRIP